MKKTNAKIVIGLGYGDEGKGITTNWLAKNHNKKSIVVRFSGGQQAGHTVHHEGIKHIFSNFGAGTLVGLPTYFSEHTTIYPISIILEKSLLNRNNISTDLTVHPMTRITTPWDVFWNRGCADTLSHGTCGRGVGATMSRNEGTYQLRAIDLTNTDIFKEKLKQIEKYYYSKGLKFSPELEKEIFDFNLSILQLNIEIEDYDFLSKFKTIIFEGSQGVMLDKDHGIFPNVTYANTTSKNAMEICDKLGIEDREIYCVTRAYSTRHGKGNGEYKGEPIELTETEHEININNKYQGEFLTSKINYDVLNYALSVNNLYSKKYKHFLMVTCCNQVKKEDSFNPFYLNSIVDIKNIYFSHTFKGDFNKIH